MTRGDWEAATPKCPHGEIANIPGKVCGEPLEYAPEITPLGDDHGGTWWCPTHGLQFTGEIAARRGGYVAMWFAGAA